MKHLLLLLFFCTTFHIAFAQDSLLQSKNEYLIVLIKTRASKKATVEIDNGSKIQTLKDNQGDQIIFPTTAAAINYLSNRGWGLFLMKKIDAIETDKVHYIFRRKK
ncbi:MAG: hypothetical protein INR69_18845 [Mucilaginibacter polytrichastri]|nr:hypothetical protein [Mucilaginibacter polytrichastri]